MLTIYCICLIFKFLNLDHNIIVALQIDLNMFFWDYDIEYLTFTARLTVLCFSLSKLFATEITAGVQFLVMTNAAS